MGFAKTVNAERRRPLPTADFTMGGQHWEAWAADWMENGEPIESIISDANSEQKRGSLLQHGNNFANGNLNQAQHWTVGLPATVQNRRKMVSSIVSLIVVRNVERSNPKKFFHSRRKRKGFHKNEEIRKNE
jgi:hypothetical protein